MEINLQGKDSKNGNRSTGKRFSYSDVLMHQHFVLRMKKWNNFMMILKAKAGSDSEYKIITGDYNAKIGTKTKKKTSRALEHLK